MSRIVLNTSHHRCGWQIIHGLIACAWLTQLFACGGETNERVSDAGRDAAGHVRDAGADSGRSESGEQACSEVAVAICLAMKNCSASRDCFGRILSPDDRHDDLVLGFATCNPCERDVAERLGCSKPVLGFDVPTCMAAIQQATCRRDPVIESFGSAVISAECYPR